MEGWEVNQRAIAAKEAGDPERELAILLKGVRAGVDTPYTYERAAMLLERQDRFEDALHVLKQSLGQVAPSSPTAEAMARRRVRLEKRQNLPQSAPASPARRVPMKTPLGVELPKVPPRDPWADVWAAQQTQLPTTSGLATLTTQLVVSGRSYLGAEFDQPLPFASRGNVDFVFVGGQVRYVDLEGSGQADTWATCSISQEVSRLSALVIDPRWVREAVQCCERIIGIEQRGATGVFGFQAGNDSWPFRQIAREVTGRNPATFPSDRELSSLAAPRVGHWLYCQDVDRFVRAAYSTVSASVVPSCVLYRGVSRNDLFLHGLLDAMTQRGRTPTTCVLPDIPSLRSFAMRYAASQPMPDTSLLRLEEQMITAPIKPARRGVVIRGEYGISHYVPSGGVESSAADFVAALEYLESRFLVRLTPTEVLSDPLLRSQLGAIPREGAFADGLPLESAAERDVRVQFERFYAQGTEAHRHLLELVSPVGVSSETAGRTKRHWWKCRTPRNGARCGHVMEPLTVT
ncbi:MAG: hypothetical protein DLM65_00555 [Candidatus Aeolococcus gillhamiae]|uniref:Tetratricopeptide repeat protein n=1 Tax=Candidatus Aeolococcus gillhamiae TaxID=3127015 RepID=A0A2W5ZFH4_9BACT|nr:MAG: hypothetical protein DLM65_00555 [Candidatus Dormibacter sp. RRmetagenome_bin12]